MEANLEFIHKISERGVMGKMKLSTMLGLGFGVVIFVFFVVSTIAFLGLNRSNNGFEEYRELARDTNLAGRVQANMLLVRFYVKDFIQKGERTSVQNYNQRLDLLHDMMEQAQQEIQNPERSRNVDLISDSIDDYDRGFQQVQEFKNRRDGLVYTYLNPDGAKMRQNLTKIMESAFRDNDLSAAYYAGRMQEHLLLARLYAAKFLDTNDASAVERVREEMGRNMEESAEILTRELQNPERRALFKEVMEFRQDYIIHFEELATLIQQRNVVIANELDRIGPIIADAAEEVKLSVKYEQDQLGPALQSSNEQIEWMIGFLFLAGIAMASLVAWRITVLVKRPLGAEPSVLESVTQQVAQGKTQVNLETTEMTGVYKSLQEMVEALKAKVMIAEQIAQGNLTVQPQLVSEEDALGHAFAQMIGDLNEILSNVAAAAAQVAEGSGQISGASQSLSQGAASQAASVEEISATMTSIKQQTEQNAENAQMAQELSQTSRQQAELGNQQMQDMLSAMGEINQSSENISKIIKSIDEIAFQTNLLAINAAVEAARAGSTGKGFAVVAEEVRNLAQRSADAAKESTSIIEDSLHKVEMGSNTSQETASALNEIVDNVNKFTDLVSEISDASVQQTSGIREVSEGLSQLSEITQNNAQIAEETAAASQEQAAQSKLMKSLISRFQLNSDTPPKADTATTSPAASHVRQIEYF